MASEYFLLRDINWNFCVVLITIVSTPREQGIFQLLKNEHYILLCHHKTCAVHHHNFEEWKTSEMDRKQTLWCIFFPNTDY
jgi:hypothetical protein